MRELWLGSLPETRLQRPRGLLKRIKRGMMLTILLLDQLEDSVFTEVEVVYVWLHAIYALG